MAIGYTNLTDEIDPQTPAILKQGDRVTLEFDSNPSKWIRASQISIIEWRLNKNKDITIISANYWGENTISFDVEVTNAEALMTERKIIALIIAASPAYFYLTHKPEIDKIPAAVVETVKKAASWTPTIAIAVGIIAVLILSRK